MTVSAFDEITKKTPEKSLLAVKKQKSGRNNLGRITVRHRGGGNKKKYRIIDFRKNGKKSYIIAPVGISVGDVLYTGEGADIKPGNVLPIANIPVGTYINNIELYPGKGSQLVRAAGAAAQLMAKENGVAQVRLPSGEVRIVRLDCRATIGQVGNLDHENIHLGKAGKTRYLGIRPTVRGSVMNPVDHPHGGGEGRSPIGRPSPVTPWGKPTLGYKTRKKKNRTDKFIVKRRNAK